MSSCMVRYGGGGYPADEEAERKCVYVAGLYTDTTVEDMVTVGSGE